MKVHSDDRRNGRPISMHVDRVTWKRREKHTITAQRKAHTDSAAPTLPLTEMDEVSDVQEIARHDRSQLVHHSSSKASIQASN